MVSLSKPGVKQPFCSGASLLSDDGRTFQALPVIVFSGCPSRFAGGQRTRAVLRPVAGHGCRSNRPRVCLGRHRGARSSHFHSALPWQTTPTVLPRQVSVSVRLSTQSGVMQPQPFVQSLVASSAAVAPALSAERRSSVMASMLGKAIELQVQQPPNQSIKRTGLRPAAYVQR